MEIRGHSRREVAERPFHEIPLLKPYSKSVEPKRELAFNLKYGSVSG